MFTVREHTLQSTSNVIVAADSPSRCLLDYIQSDGRFSALSFKDSLDEQGVIVDEDALVPLLANMRSLSEQWRESIGEHGDRVFYVDN